MIDPPETAAVELAGNLCAQTFTRPGRVLDLEHVLPDIFP